ncbi:hypothetical protein, partial [Planktotalea sp.]|uniref:hypothetical protein n=1 Tax=Planktotalea sp. TaxID=2029877 RepID=UPI003297BCCC
MDLGALEIALRGVSAGFSIIFLSVICRDRIATAAKLALIALVLATSARIWSNLPPQYQFEELVLFALRVIGAGGALAVTVLTLIIFLDSKRFLWVWIASGVLITVGTLVAIWFKEVVPFLRVFAGAHFLGLLLLVVKTRDGDLLNARRQARPVVAVFLMLFCIGQAFTSTQLVGQPSQVMRLLHISIYNLVIFSLAVWSLRANLENWPGPVTPSTKPLSNPSVEKSNQKVLIARINEAMDAGIWKQEGLTVGALAREVNVPEHRVRTAINQILGHK